MADEIQQEVEFTEAELTGETTPGTAESAAVKTAEVAAPPVEAEPVKEAVAPEPVKPPKGYIPEGALKEERRLRKELQAKLEEAEKSKTPPVDPAALILEDPEASVRYLVEQIEGLRGEIDRRDMEREIKSVVPDFFDKAPAMEELLLGEGLSEEGIRNMIGSVGREAPTLFKVLDKLVSTPNEAALRAKIQTELTPLITADVTKLLMAKFNIVDSGVNIEKLPGGAPDGKLIVDGEGAYNKLTPEQQEKWLRGEI